MLPSPRKLRRVVHLLAMDYHEVASLMATLRAQPGVSTAALQFAILTASRTSETLRATWDEFDLPAKLWTLAPERVKSRRGHRVPLSAGALAIIEQMAAIRTSSDYVFPGRRDGQPLSSPMLRLALKRAGRGDVVPHGFRSAFRDWCGNETGFPREVAEAALAHRTGDSVEAAYRRSDALESGAD